MEIQTHIGLSKKASNKKKYIVYLHPDDAATLKDTHGSITNALTQAYPLFKTLGL